MVRWSGCHSQLVDQSTYGHCGCYGRSAGVSGRIVTLQSCGTSYSPTLGNDPHWPVLWKLLEIAYFCCPTNRFCLDNSTYPGLLVVKVWQKQTITTPWTFNAQDKVGTGSSNDWNKVGLLGVVIINHHLLPGLLVQTLDVFLAFVHDFGTALGSLESKWWQAVPGYCLDDF